VGGRTPDEIEPILIQIEENSITDHIPIMIACDKLLGSTDFEVLEAIHAKVRE